MTKMPASQTQAQNSYGHEWEQMLSFPGLRCKLCGKYLSPMFNVSKAELRANCPMKLKAEVND